MKRMHGLEARANHTQLRQLSGGNPISRWRQNMVKSRDGLRRVLFGFGTLACVAVLTHASAGYGQSTTTWDWSVGEWHNSAKWDNGIPAAGMNAGIGKGLVTVTGDANCDALTMGAYGPPDPNTAILNMVGASLYLKNLGLGDTFHATFFQTSGYVGIQEDLTANLHAGAEGNYVLYGGTLHVGGNERISLDAGDGGKGAFIHTGGDNSFDGALYLGAGQNSAGLYSISVADPCNQPVVRGPFEFVGYAGGGTFTHAGGINLTTILHVGELVWSSGVYQLSGGELSAGDPNEPILSQIIGYGGAGSFVQTDGNANFYGALVIGYTHSENGRGSYTLSGGQVHEANVGLLVASGGYGHFKQSDGNHVVDGSVYIGSGSTAEGNYVMTGGRLWDSNSYVGFYGKGMFDQSDGNHLIAGALEVGTHSTGDGTYIISGGKLNVGATLSVGGTDASAGGGGVFSVDGGTTTVAGRVRVWSGGTLNLGGGSLLTGESNLVNVFSDGLIRATRGSNSLGTVLPIGDPNILIGSIHLDPTANLSLIQFREANVGIGAGAKLTIQSTSKTTSVMNTLVISGSLDAWTGTLDLKQNCLVIRDGNLATITNQIKTGLYGGPNGYWDGNGITSSTAAGDETWLTGIGVAKASDLGLGGQDWEGFRLDGNEILVKYTYYGDTDLNGSVDYEHDYYQWFDGWQNQLTGWYWGDFNYDGVVDFENDYYMWLGGWQDQGGALRPGGPGFVPEPGTLFLLVGGLMTIAGRRRRPRS